MIPILAIACVNFMNLSTAIGLIIGTLVIYRQLTYIRSRDVGLDRDQVLVVQNAYAAGVRS